MVIKAKYAPDSQLQHHRPYLPRQVHPGGPPHPVDRNGGRPPIPRPAPRHHGPGTGAGHHHQEQHHPRGGVW